MSSRRTQIPQIPSEDDQVALEANGNAPAIARILQPRVGRVVVATRRDCEALARANTEIARIDAKPLARRLVATLLAGSWLPDDAQGHSAGGARGARHSCRVWRAPGQRTRSTPS
jgi:hypothetical protein